MGVSPKAMSFEDLESEAVVTTVVVEEVQETVVSISEDETLS